ncbi:MAG TPA: PfkB family carbohydrate kinase [Candidatus Lustribacter sp.]|nr:PfkB family carbohydrate kinase [Candidatus Lustribacter sp.]
MSRPEAGARNRVVCVGNAALDRSFVLAGPARLGTSNPAEVRSGFGGVARNVAENLARLGIPVALVTQVGEDAGGRALRDDCAALGIDVRGVLRSPVHPTAEYVAIVDALGELVIGAAATAAIDALSVAQLGAAFDEDGRTAWTFADCTLPAPVLAALVEDRRAGGPPLAIDAVSTARAERLPRDLAGLDLLFLNEDEARTLTGNESGSIVDVARAVRERGAASVVLTRGGSGIVLATVAGTSEIAVPPATPVDVSGAGDALIAGTLFGLMSGAGLSNAVRTGSRVAKLTLESPTTVSRALTPAAIA